jgi:hypothetical protein
MDKFADKSPGFAFVQMETQEEPNRAITDFNDSEINGRGLLAERACGESAPVAT